jgi:hypothetical protein
MPHPSPKPDTQYLIVFVFCRSLVAERIHYKITGKLQEVRFHSSIVQLPQCSRTDSMIGEWEYSDIYGEM